MIAHEEWSPATNLDLANSYCCTTTRTKGGSLRALRVKLVPNNMGVCFDHADSFEIDHFDKYFHLVFWLKVNDDTVFEAIVLGYDRYQPLLGARSCHKYLVLWQDLKISISYVNHVLLAILRHMGTFKNVFNILIVQISGLGRTLHLAKDMNDQMVEFGFQAKGESWHFAKKRNTDRYVRKGCHINSK